MAIDRLIAAAKAIRDQADTRFELENWRPIDTLLLSELTEAVEDIEQLARHVSPQPSPDRAALVERMAHEIAVVAERRNWTAQDAAVKALAAVEAAGWGPRPEPITAREIDEIATGVGFDMLAHRSAQEITERAFASLPERIRRLVLGVSGE